MNATNKSSAPLSRSQYGIYAECVSHENEIFYNLPFLFVFDGSLDADRLCRAIETTIKAHPTFFTRIGVNDEGEPVQSIDMENEKINLTVEQVTDIEAEKQRFIEPFKLYGGRLFHTKVMRDSDHVYWFWDMHHIIGDGASFDIVIRDVEAAYNCETLAPEEMTMQELASPKPRCANRLLSRKASNGMPKTSTVATPSLNFSPTSKFQNPLTPIKSVCSALKWTV